MIISLFVSPSAFTFLIMPPNVSQEFLPPEGPHVLGVLTHRSASSILIFHRENLSLDQGRAILREEGSKTRVVPFTRTPLSCCVIGLKYARQRHKRSSVLYGTITTPSHSQYPARIRSFDALRTPHSFRHGFARAYLENGGDLATLAQLMGHSDVKVTASLYAVFTDGELARRREMFSPLRELGGV